MEYIILIESSKYSLQEEVIEYINKGWKPLGGVSISDWRSTMYFTQAMIKKEN